VLVLAVAYELLRIVEAIPNLSEAFKRYEESTNFFSTFAQKKRKPSNELAPNRQRSKTDEAAKVSIFFQPFNINKEFRLAGSVTKQRLFP